MSSHPLNDFIIKIIRFFVPLERLRKALDGVNYSVLHEKRRQRNWITRNFPYCFLSGNCNDFLFKNVIEICEIRRGYLDGAVNPIIKLHLFRSDIFLFRVDTFKDVNYYDYQWLSMIQYKMNTINMNRIYWLRGLTAANSLHPSPNKFHVCEASSCVTSLRRQQTWGCLIIYISEWRCFGFDRDVRLFIAWKLCLIRSQASALVYQSCY